MLVARLFFLFLLSVNIVFAGDISQVVFTNELRTIKTNEVALLTVQLQYTGDSHPTTCMKMTTNSTTGQFSSSDTSWNSVDKLTINSNWTNKKFYYKDSTVGNYILTVKIVPVSCSSLTDQEAQWTAEQDIVVSESGGIISQPQSSEPTTVVGSGSWPVEPQIYANAGSDKTAVAGADVVFTGQALGLNKEPLENARYFWSFGDGGMAEGKSVRHIYKYPSEYIAVLDVSSGEYSASDIALVKVIPNQLTISEANKDFIKLQNDSSITLDISSWFLRSGQALFKFPENTLIKAKSSLPITSEISKLEINKNIEILYPNGSVAFLYDFISQPKAEIVKPTTAVESKPMEIKKPEVKTESFNLATSTEQVANVASVFTDEQTNQGNTKKWLLIILGLGIFSGIGFIFIRRY